jgi:hypothetical protein
MRRQQKLTITTNEADSKQTAISSINEQQRSDSPVHKALADVKRGRKKLGSDRAEALTTSSRKRAQRWFAMVRKRRRKRMEGVVSQTRRDGCRVQGWVFQAKQRKGKKKKMLPGPWDLLRAVGCSSCQRRCKNQRGRVPEEGS